MQAAVEGLQLEIVFRAPTGETAQTLPVAHLYVDNPPRLVRTKRPTRARRCRVDSHLRGRVFEHQFQFANGRFPADRRQIGPIRLSPAMHHVTRRALTLAEEKPLSRTHVS